MTVAPESKPSFIDRTPRWRARWALAAFIVTAVITRGITLTLHLQADPRGTLPQKRTSAVPMFAM